MIVSAYVFWNWLAAIYMTVISTVILKRCQLSYKHIFLVDVLVVLSFFIGSRLLYAALYPARIMAVPSRLWALKLVNFSLYGGLIMALMIWFIIGKYMQLRRLGIADQLVPHLGIAIMLSKLGCFFNGCCYGVVTSVPWAMHFERAEQNFFARTLGGSSLLGLFKDTTQSLRHPTQLYEVGAAFFAVCLTFYLSYLRNRQLPKSWLNKDGVILAFFCLSFSVGRLIIFYFREFSGATPLSNFVRGPLLYGVIIGISGLFILINSHNKSAILELTQKKN